jgi:hypothetical protein
VEEIELADKKTPEEINQAVIQASGKLVLIDKLLPKLKVISVIHSRSKLGMSVCVCVCVCVCVSQSSRIKD